MPEKKRNWVWLIIVLVVLIVFLPVLMWMLWGGYMPGTMGMMGYASGLMFLIPIAFLVLIALGAYYLITESRTIESVPSRGEGALEILKERYAKGEITRKQFLKMKEALES
jgi:uncharacterized membrane protein